MDTSFVYIPAHLDYMLYEVLKVRSPPPIPPFPRSPRLGASHVFRIGSAERIPGGGGATHAGRAEAGEGGVGGPEWVAFDHSQDLQRAQGSDDTGSGRLGCAAERGSTVAVGPTLRRFRIEGAASRMRSRSRWDPGTVTCSCTHALITSVLTRGRQVGEDRCGDTGIQLRMRMPIQGRRATWWSVGEVHRHLELGVRMGAG